MTSTRRGSAAVLGAAARRALQAEGKQSAVTDDQSSMSSIDGWEQLAGRTKTDVAKLFRKVGRRAREAARRAHPPALHLAVGPGVAIAQPSHQVGEHLPIVVRHFRSHRLGP